MRKALILVLGLCLIAIFAGNLFSQEKEQAESEKPWFDMEKCAFCKSLADEPGLMEHMNYEYHEMPNGILSITIIDEGYHDAYMRVMDAMQKTAEEIGKTGKLPYMCGHCEAYGRFMMAGVEERYYQGDLADIHMMMSDDPEMVEALHEFAARAMKEMAALEEEEMKKAKE